LNIPLHIAEQGKEKIAKYVDLYQKKERAGAESSDADGRLSEVYDVMQKLFVKEEKTSGYYYNYEIKMVRLHDHIGDYYSYSGHNKMMEKIKCISQFADEVWTVNQLLQDAANDRIQKLLSFQEAREKFENFK
jgi:hypothetical protein